MSSLNIHLHCQTQTHTHTHSSPCVVAGLSRARALAGSTELCCGVVVLVVSVRSVRRYLVPSALYVVVLCHPCVCVLTKLTSPEPSEHLCTTVRASRVQNFVFAIYREFVYKYVCVVCPGASLVSRRRGAQKSCEKKAENIVVEYRHSNANKIIDNFSFIAQNGWT